jgi:AAA+ ATPase superfamily predicted ATPase
MGTLPFVFGTSATGENFTDRKEETTRLVSNFQHGINTILVSPRRWGKTSLVEKAASVAAGKTLKIVFVDIFSCRDENDFCSRLATAIVRQTSTKLEEWLESTKTFLNHLSPKITVGSDPMNEFSLSLDLNPKSQDIDDVLNLPEKIASKKKIRIVVCIDEFQQIGEFKDSVTFQKKLRTAWQHQKLISYCLYGSRKHLMNELFQKRSLPFYKFGDLVFLQKIETKDWVEYIQGRFKSTGKSISKTIAERICPTVENHSAYVQQLSWLVWARTEKKATEKGFNAACKDLLDQNTPLFEKQTEGLSSYQINFLRALCDGVAEGFTSKAVLVKYDLGSSANVGTIKRALEKKEIIDIEGQKVYIADPVLVLWLKRFFF